MERLTDEQRKLVEDNYNLIFGFLRKIGCLFAYTKTRSGRYVPRYGSDKRKEWDPDYIQAIFDAAEIGLIKAAKAYDPERGAFSTLAFAAMEGELALLKRRVGSSRYMLKFHKEVSLEGFADFDDEENADKNWFLGEDDPRFGEVEERAEAKAIVADLLPLLTPSEEKMVKDLMSGMSYSEIAKSHNVSRQRVHQMLCKIRTKTEAVMKEREEHDEKKGL